VNEVALAQTDQPPYGGVADEYEKVFAGRKARFGPYGEPILVPLSIWRASWP
jgi:hypothetical protein